MDRVLGGSSSDSAASNPVGTGLAPQGPSLRQEVPLWRRLAENRLVLLGIVIAVLLVLVALLADLISPRDPLAVNMAAALRPPNWEQPFGTDRFGRDVLSRIIHGSRISLGVAFSSVAIALIAGTFLGLVSGFFGGMLDNVISRVMDIFFCFPVLLLAIVVAAMLGPGINNAIMAIAIVYTPFFSRVARAPVLAEREKEYILAAEVMGARRWRILLRHIFPNVLSPIVVQASVTIAYAILTEASLSYLGLGTQIPFASWGTTLNEGRTYLDLAPWVSVFPGVAIMLAVLAFNLVGDGLRDALDPHLR